MIGARNPVLRMLLFRTTQIAPVIILGTLIVFSLVQLMPGDPAVAIAGDTATPERLAALRHQLGIDRPLIEQYWIWLFHALHGDLSKSVITGQEVLPYVFHVIPNTLYVVSGALFLSLVIGVPLGIASARRVQSHLDGAITSIVSLGVAVPHFWAAMLLVSYFALEHAWFPATGGVSTTSDLTDALRHIALPACALATGGIPEVTRQLRSALLGELSSQHVRTLHAKGLSEIAILWKHCLKNVAVTLLTISGLLFNRLLGATVAVEIVFAIPGIGAAVVNGALQKDIPVIQGIVAILMFIVLITNIVVDLICVLVDPRVAR